MINISLDGLLSPGGDEDRNLAMLKVTYNGNEYDWKVYIPAGEDIGSYLDSISSVIMEDIDRKELLWQSAPKTKIIQGPDGESIQVDVLKSEIVCPDVPDFYAKRRSAYPKLLDQMGALWKGEDSAEYKSMMSVIEQIKTENKNPSITLAGLKEEKIKQIELWRKEARFAPGSVFGRTWQLDEKSQSLLGQAILIASLGGSLPTAWIDADNNPLAITDISQLLQIAAVAAAQTDYAYIRSLELKSIVRDVATDTKEKLDAIVW